MLPHRIRFHLFPLSLLSACAWPVLAGDLCGRVIDPSGAAVPGAAVEIYSRETPARTKTVSNDGGEFCLSGLPHGNYLAEASAPGFGGSTAAPASVGGDGPAFLALALGLEKVSTRISVTAASSAQSSDEISKALDVVDSNEMERRAEFSIPESLRLVPGVRVRQQGGPGSLASIHMRGMRSFDTSVLIDGFRLRDSSAPQGEATGLLEDLYAVNVGRIEVLRGSGSSLYGSHAMGGVLNIVSDHGGGPLRGSVETEGGGLGLFRGAARLAGAGWKQRVLYSGGASHLNVTRGIDGDDRTRNLTGHGYAQLRLRPSSVLSGRVLAANSFLQLNDSPYAAPDGNLPPAGYVTARPLPRDQVRRVESGLPVDWGAATFVPSANDPDNRRSSNFTSAMTAFTQQLGSLASVRASYQGLVTRRATRDGPGGTYFEPSFNNLSRYDSRIDIAQARTDIQASSWQLISAGFEFEREKYDNVSIEENSDPAQRSFSLAAVSQRSHSLFAQDQLRLLRDRLQISVSGRLQTFQLDRPQFEGGPPAYAGAGLGSPPNAYTGDAALAWFARTTGTKFRAHAGNGYRAPSLFERLGTSFFFGFFSPFGDPRLKPERTIGLDGGFDQYFASNRLKVSATYFYTRLQEVIVFDFSGVISPDTDPYGRFGGYRNTSGGIARGVETSVEATPTRSLRIHSSYTYTNARERVSTTIDGSLRSFNISDHMVSLLVTQRFRRRVDATFDFSAASSYDFPFFTAMGSRTFRFGAPIKGDLVLSYTHPVSDSRSLRLFTRVENLFNRAWYEGGFFTPGIWATGGLKLQF
ncbi:MAG: TonB-dependent receptor plug domain-containing protein [Bryobacteraceae bacterium]|nr:TonB-dependent receptor plug domain-containing protein [Bryobacteraceae bacterium]